MIRIVNAQGTIMLTNAGGVAFQMPMALARELFRKPIDQVEDLRRFLEFWGGDPDGIRALLEDEFLPADLEKGIEGLGLALETLVDLEQERTFFRDSREREPAELVLHPGELGTLAKMLGEEGYIENNPLRPMRDEAGRKYLEGAFGVPVRTDATVKVGGFR